MHQLWDAVIEPVLRASGAKILAEVGVAHGTTTEKLLRYARNIGGTVHAVDPQPLFDVDGWQKRFGGTLVVHRGLGLEVLPTLAATVDVILLDGDHNWYSVYHELLTIERMTGRGKFPVVLVHDTGWPYARRDRYDDPSQIPEAFRRPFSKGGLLPVSSLPQVAHGMNQDAFHALEEGGPHNGILTAVEDFLSQSQRAFRSCSIPGWYGITVLADADAAVSGTALARFFDTWQTDPALLNHIAALERARIGMDLEFGRARAIVNAQHDRRKADADAYARTRKEFEADADRLRMVAADLERALSAERAAHNSLRSGVDRMRETLSWRLTGPLRIAQAWLRSLRTRRSAAPPVPPVPPPTPVLLPSPPAPASDIARCAADVSVIVTSRNYGRFLRECLASIVGQTVRPREVIYCDDGSDDESVAVASGFPGVRILQRDHTGVAAARNAAVAACSGSLLLHVDGDDHLAPTLLEEHIKALLREPRALFAYGPAHGFDAHTAVWEIPAWDRDRLWIRNFVNTSSLVRRHAFETAGGWREGLGTLWDWDLWLRISEHGPGVPSDGVLHYRRHPHSWSLGRPYAEPEHSRLLGRARRRALRTTICCALSGRLPGLLPLWVEALAQSVLAEQGLSYRPDLILLDNSPGGMAAALHAAVEPWRHAFGEVFVVPYPVHPPPKTGRDRQHQISTHLAEAYNRMMGFARGDALWFVEDDVVVPPHAFGRLLERVTDGTQPLPAASGLYHSRHQENDFVARTVDGARVRQADIREGPVDFAGTGCLMVFRPLARHAFSSHWADSPAHDWAWSDVLRRRGTPVILDPSVRCRHYKTETEYV